MERPTTETSAGPPPPRPYAVAAARRRLGAMSKPAARSFTKTDTDDVLRKPLIVAIASAALVAPGCGGNDVSEQEQDRAIAAAKQAYEGARAEGEDLDIGPCIAEKLPDLPDWVADVAHDPREDIDDEPENQCQRYREGEASHFVELTPEGELIRAE
jgi:hypothetical protein